MYVVSAPKLWSPQNMKSKKPKLCSNLKWLGSAYSSNEEVLNSKIYGPSAPTIREEVASHDTKTSNFRYNWYAQKISGNVTVGALKKFNQY